MAEPYHQFGFFFFFSTPENIIGPPGILYSRRQFRELLRTWGGGRSWFVHKCRILPSSSTPGGQIQSDGTWESEIPARSVISFSVKEILR